MSTECAIRTATAGDADVICDIYNEGIVDRLATLETELRTAEERRRWLAARGPRHPVIVATLDGSVVGWASLNAFNPRRAYDHVADFSVYVARRYRGRGIGGRLLDELERLARRFEYHKLVLAAFPHNSAGTRLYVSRGFREVGVYREQGRLDGRWVDVVVMEKVMAAG